MADVRALLKAKRQEVRITHPYAAYGANGALRCTVCNTAIKSASAWERHLGTKAHRVFAANLEDIREGVESARRDEGEGGQQVEMATATAMGKKRQRTEEREIAPPVVDASQDARTGGTAASHPAFPAGFFSDPARVPPRTTSIGGQDDDDDDDDENVEMAAHDQDAKVKTTGAAPPPKSQFDAEWDAFERDMQSLSHQQQQQQQRSSSSSRPATETAELTYAHATIAAEPELVSRFEGLPVVDGAPAAAQEGVMEAGAGTEEVGRRVMSEEELERRRKDRDERELIMDRLVEEERAQEDAYGRVALLKNRIQMLKQKRELAKEAKGKKVASDMET